MFAEDYFQSIAWRSWADKIDKFLSGEEESVGSVFAPFLTWQHLAGLAKKQQIQLKWEEEPVIEDWDGAWSCLATFGDQRFIMRTSAYYGGTELVKE